MGYSVEDAAVDGREKAMMQEVESSLKVLNDQIAMKISSTKELVLRKNYISGGEQETLSKDAFTITGDVATVTEAEFLNLNCLKVEFNNTGSIVIEQNVGDLPEGIYRISVETAYPLSDGNAKRPYYLEYGFTGNRSTEYYSGYEADEFHSFTKKLEITAASNGFKVDGGFKIYCGSDTFSDQTDTFQVFNLGHVTSGGHLVFASDGTTVAYLSSSSKRYKDHVADMTIAEAEKMLNVPVVWFKYKENYLSPDDWLNGKKLPGFYAEDVYDIFPEAAQLNEDGEAEDWNFRVIIPAMMKLIQELYSERRKME